MLAAEYGTLRTEIGRYQDHQKDLVQVAFVTFAAVLGLVGALASGMEGSPIATRDAGIVLLLAPIMFGLLAWTHANRSFRIVELAEYIHGWLGQLARTVAEGDLPKPLAEKIFRWETFKFNARVARAKEARIIGRLPKRLRLIGDLGPIYLVFVVPSVVAVFSYWKLFGVPTSLDVLALVAVDVLMVVSSLRYVAPRPGKSSEEQGLNAATENVVEEFVLDAERIVHPSPVEARHER